MQLMTRQESSITRVTQRNYSGEMETVAVEDVGDKRIFHYSQKINGILDSNERRRINEDTAMRTGEFHQVASVPFVLWNLWESLGITADQKELRKAIERQAEEVKVTNKKCI